MATRLEIAELVVKLTADSTEMARGLSGATRQAAAWAADVGRTVVQTGLKVVAAGAIAATTAVVALGGALAKLALDAAPLEGIGAVFETFAQRGVVSIDALRQASRNAIPDFELMRRANEALAGAATELQQPLGEALPQLLEIARAAALATGKDFNFLFASLVSGVKRNAPLLIDNAQIALSTTEAHQRFAEANGLAADSLTKEQEQLALLNEVLRQGQPMVDQFGSSQMTAAEGMAQFTTRVRNFLDQAGIAMLPVLGNVSSRFSELAQQVLPGLLNVIQTTVAPAFDILVDKVGGAASALVDAARKFIDRFGMTLSNAASNALEWGINISVQLATGLIQGASAAITAAMTFIGNLLSSWLAPGSPPAVAPNIDQWGAGAFEEYLKGFTEASFDILDDLQSPLQSALQSMVRMGTISAKDAGQIFRELSVDFAAAIDQFVTTGEVMPGLFDKLREKGGEFGDELAELARRQLELAGATNEVQKAEKALLASREKEEAAQEELNTAMDEYNALLASGAAPDVLAAKRKEFQAAKDRLKAAKSEVDEAEKQKAAAEKQLGPLQEQARLQERLLAQLMEIANTQERAADAAAGAAGRAAGGARGGGLGMPIVPPSIAAPALGIPDLAPIANVFEDAKAMLQERFAGIFQPVTDAWQKDMLPALENIGETWGWFSGIISEFTETKLIPALNTISDFIQENIIPIIAGLSAAILTLAVPAFITWASVAIPAAIASATTLVTTLGPVILLVGAIGAAVGLLVAAWQNDWGGIRTTLTDFWNNIAKPIFETLREWIADKITAAITTLTGFWERVLLPALKIVWSYIRDSLIPLLLAIANVISAVVGKAVEALAGLWQNILQPVLEAIWGFISESLNPIFFALGKIISESINPIFLELVKTISENLGPILLWVGETLLPPLQTAFDNIADAIESVITWLGDLADKIGDLDLPDWLTPGSPTPLELGLRGIGDAMKDLSSVELPTLAASISAVGAVGRGETTNTFTMNVNGPVNQQSVIQGFEMMRALVGA